MSRYYVESATPTREILKMGLWAIRDSKEKRPVALCYSQGDAARIIAALEKEISK